MFGIGDDQFILHNKFLYIIHKNNILIYYIIFGKIFQHKAIKLLK